MESEEIRRDAPFYRHDGKECTVRNNTLIIVMGKGMSEQKGEAKVPIILLR